MILAPTLLSVCAQNLLRIELSDIDRRGAFSLNDVDFRFRVVPSLSLAAEQKGSLPMWNKSLRAFARRCERSARLHPVLLVVGAAAALTIAACSPPVPTDSSLDDQLGVSDGCAGLPRTSS